MFVGLGLSRLSVHPSMLVAPTAWAFHPTSVAPTAMASAGSAEPEFTELAAELLKLSQEDEKEGHDEEKTPIFPSGHISEEAQDLQCILARGHCTTATRFGGA